MYIVESEIKLLLLGHVSVGKTTFLNALFQDRYSEVAMRRTTAAVNHFRLSPLAKEPEAEQKLSEEEEEEEEEEFTKASEAFEETTLDNRCLRETGMLCEKTFDIEVNDPLVEMRRDTRLVVVDMPGVNEARTEQMYLDYVTRKWDSFDAVIVVMDGKTGVNTQEKVGLLEFVKKNLQTKKLPVMVLCNKIDDTRDEELMGLVQEVRTEVERIFEVGDRERALEEMLAAGQDADLTLVERMDQWSPVFIPMSAESAFLYRLVSRLDMDGLRHLEHRVLERIGHNDLGAFKWRRLSHEEKLEAVYTMAQDTEYYQERLALSNFDKVLKTFHCFLSGDRIQGELIQAQLEIALRKVQSAESGFTNHLAAIYDRSVAVGTEAAIGRAVDDLFWMLLADMSADAFAKLSSSPEAIVDVATPMKELLRYAKGLHKKMNCTPGAVGGKAKALERRRKIVREMTNLLNRQMAILLDKGKEYKFPAINKEFQQVVDTDEAHWTWSAEEEAWFHEGTRYKSQDTHPAGDKPEHWTFSSGKWHHLLTAATRDLPEEENPATFSKVQWETLSPRDWHDIIASVLCLRYDRFFCEECSQGIVDLEWMKQHGRFARLEACKNCPTDACNCENTMEYFERALSGTRLNGVFTPDNPLLYRQVVHVKTPKSLTDPAHWGYIGRLFCDYMASLEEA